MTTTEHKTALERMQIACNKVSDGTSLHTTFIQACAAVANDMVRETLMLTEPGNEKPLEVLGLEAITTSTANGYNKATALERLALIHSEVSECLESIRHGDKDYYEVDGKPEGPRAELADVLIRTVEMATWLGGDVPFDSIVKSKMEYNRIRKDVPAKGGEKSI